MAVWPAAENAIFAGFHARGTNHADCGQAEFEQFPDRGCPGRHAMLETKIVDEGEFLGGKHHLQSFATHLVHGIDTFEAN